MNMNTASELSADLMKSCLEQIFIAPAKTTVSERFNLQSKNQYAHCSGTCSGKCGGFIDETCADAIY